MLLSLPQVVDFLPNDLIHQIVAENLIKVISPSPNLRYGFKLRNLLQCTIFDIYVKCARCNNVVHLIIYVYIYYVILHI